MAIGHFHYLHVDTTGIVTNGENIRPGQMIGWTCKGLWHVHLSESMELYGLRVYVNPLHPGMKLGPYVDRKPPRIHAIKFYRPAMPAWTAGARASFPQAGKQFPDATKPETDVPTLWPVGAAAGHAQIPGTADPSAPAHCFGSLRIITCRPFPYIAG